MSENDFEIVRKKEAQRMVPLGSTAFDDLAAAAGWTKIKISQRAVGYLRSELQAYIAARVEEAKAAAAAKKARAAQAKPTRRYQRSHWRCGMREGGMMPKKSLTREYDEMCRAIEDCHREIMRDDIDLPLEVWQRIARNTEPESKACSIRLRAERRHTARLAAMRRRQAR